MSLIARRRRRAGVGDSRPTGEAVYRSGIAETEPVLSALPERGSALPIDRWRPPNAHI